ncbi:hypothetical protein [Aliiroseovarius sp. F20344]|uniref:hypothetical protein n=1 Tax=Aliiroseovarius sp. F20344 TaxID=2926414 RepID=UPI001FF556E6|nr:hypothetical protein [Aliiroseovarius sp. F20344]MCK0142923.1 hypothetical protein [Aliiroseovarius sp. F20344]
MARHFKLLKTSVLAFGFAIAAQVAVASEQIGAFTVFIGKPDLSNAKGAALSDPASILRRDRANYHRFGVSQPGDEWDPYFGSNKSRKNIKALLEKGGIGPKAAKRFKNGGTVLIRVMGAGGKPTAIMVSVPN